MAEDWAADVKRYDANADDDVIAGIIRYCGIALRKRDSSLVSFTDAKETGRVRENFLKKKLGLAHPDSELDRAIADVGQRMKGDNSKNRVTAYYLLTDRFGAHHLFRKSGTAKPREIAATPGAAPMATASSAGSIATPAIPRTRGTTDAANAGATSAGRQALYGDRATASDSEKLGYGYYKAGQHGGAGTGWLWGLLALALLLLVLGWLFADRSPDSTIRTEGGAETVAAAGAPAPAPAPTPTAGTLDLNTAPAEGSVTIPAGAGVTVETRDAKPVAKVYFDTAKTEVVPAFAETAAAFKAWLDSHPGSTLAISGYNDPTGNAAANAELSKNRAQAVQAALLAAGVPETAAALVKPAAATDATTDNASARRVEVVVR